MKKTLTKINNWVSKNLPQDKLLHFIAGGAIQYGTLSALTLTNDPIYFPLFSCLSVTAAGAAGCAKEMIDDKVNPGSSDIKDIFATLLGGAVGLGMVLLTKLIYA